MSERVTDEEAVKLWKTAKTDVIKTAIRSELRRQANSGTYFAAKYRFGDSEVHVDGVLDLDALAQALWATALFGDGTRPITDSNGEIVGWARPVKARQSDSKTWTHDPDNEAGEEFAPSEPVATCDLRFVERRNKDHGHRESILQQRWVGASGAEWRDVPMESQP